MTKLDELVEKYGLDKLNTLTRYPSILTYHELNRGGVRDVLTKPGEFPVDLVIATEKVDGTNYRIVTTGDDYFIGSRERFTCAEWDRICTDDIAKAVIPVASMLSGEIDTGLDNLTVVFGEVYGWKIQAARYNENGDKSRRFAILIFGRCRSHRRKRFFPFLLKR